MRILIITESFKYGGLETQLLDYCRQLVSYGHEIYIISGNGSRMNKLKDIIGENILEVEMSPTQSLKALLSNINRISSYISENKPDLIHMHPFMSIVLGGIAAAIENKAFVVTIHSPLSITYGYNPVYRLLCKAILRDAWRVFCVSKECEERLMAFAPETRSIILPNGVDINRFKPAIVDFNGPIALIGRLDKDKLTGIKIFLELWSKLPSSYRKTIHIYGEGNAKFELETWIKSFDMKPFVKFMGHEDYLETKLSSGYSLIAGMGRVVIEAGSMNLPVLLVGYDGPKCLVSIENYEKLSLRNFSGRYVEPIGIDTICNQLDELKKSPQKYMLRNLVKTNHDHVKIVQKYIDNVKDSVPGPYKWKEVFLSSIAESVEGTLFSDSILHTLLYNIEMETWAKDSIIYYCINRLIDVTKERDEIKSGNFWKLASMYYRIRDILFRRK